MKKTILFTIITLGVMIAMPSFCDTIYMPYLGKWYALSPSTKRTISYDIQGKDMDIIQHFHINAIIDQISDSIPDKTKNKCLQKPYCWIKIDKKKSRLQVLSLVFTKI